MMPRQQSRWLVWSSQAKCLRVKAIFGGTKRDRWLSIWSKWLFQNSKAKTFCTHNAEAATRWHLSRLTHLLLLLLLLEGLLLVLRCLFLLVSVLFGTTFKELLGKVLGLVSVPQIGPDVVVHFVWRIHFFQEGCKCGNWQKHRRRIFVSLASRNGKSIIVGWAPLQNTLLKSYHPDYWPCWGCVEFVHTTAWRCPDGSYWPLETTLAAFPPLLLSY